jgi:hypothetical protein
LCWHERHGGFLFTSFADGRGFLEDLTALRAIALRFAGLAAFRIVFKRLLRKERLLSSGENERLPALIAHQHFIFKRWHTFPLDRRGWSFASLHSQSGPSMQIAHLA